MKHIAIGKTYKLEVQKDIYNLVKITAINTDYLEGYFLDEPSRPIAIKHKEHLLPIIPELSEINAIKAQGLPKINQDDINDVLIDLHIYRGKEILK